MVKTYWEMYNLTCIWLHNISLYLVLGFHISKLSGFWKVCFLNIDKHETKITSHVFKKIHKCQALLNYDCDVNRTSLSSFT